MVFICAHPQRAEHHHRWRRILRVRVIFSSLSLPVPIAFCLISPLPPSYLPISPCVSAFRIDWTGEIKWNQMKWNQLKRARARLYSLSNRPVRPVAVAKGFSKRLTPTPPTTTRYTLGTPWFPCRAFEVVEWEDGYGWSRGPIYVETARTFEKCAV